MKKTLIALLVAAGMITLTTYGEVVTVNKDVKNFDSIDIRCPGKVNLKQGDTESLSIEGDKIDLDNIVVEVSGNTLEIKTKKEDMSWFERLLDFSSYTYGNNITMNISIKTIKNILIAGSVELNLESPIKAENLQVHCTGSSDMHSSDNISIVDNFSLRTAGSSSVNLKNLTAKSVTINSAGSSDITISEGSADSIEVKIAGSGKCNTIGMKTKDVSLSCYGSGKIKVNASESLESTIKGSGKVIYSGTPKTIEQNVAGSGSIMKTND